MIGKAVLLLFLLQQAVPALMPDRPVAPGVYFKLSDTQWISMKPAPVVGGNTRGLGVYVDSGGYTNLDMHVTYRGAKASLRIARHAPSFFVRESGSAADLMLVRLEQKKYERLCQTSPSSATVENKMGFKNADIIKINLFEYPDKSFSVVPEEALKPGEYLLAFGSATSGYDFGVD